jgi:hypothetical protein
LVVVVDDIAFEERGVLSQGGDDRFAGFFLDVAAGYEPAILD